MVNNAHIGGTEHHGMEHEMTEETWDNVMSTVLIVAMSSLTASLFAISFWPSRLM